MFRLKLRIEIALLGKEVGESSSEGYIAKLVAYTEWIQYLSELVKNKSLRQQVHKVNAKEISVRACIGSKIDTIIHSIISGIFP